MLIDRELRRIYPAKWVYLCKYGKRRYYLHDCTSQLKRVMNYKGIKYLVGSESKGADRKYFTMSNKDFFTLIETIDETCNT